ncbi:hypothetical protein ACRAWG_11835 [Methylobacterium sp. P31]
MARLRLGALPGGLLLQAAHPLTRLDPGGDIDGELRHLHGPTVGVESRVVAWGRFTNLRHGG